MLALLAWGKPLFAASPDQAPPLPAPTGTVVHVSTVAQLQSAVSAGGSNRTIVIAPGTYTLTSTLYLAGVSDVTLRGATDDRDDVVLVGKGLNNANYGNVRFGIWANGPRITIANLTVRDTYSHPIILNPGANSVRVYNVRLVDTGDQFIKANPDGSGGGVDNGVVEYSVMEYTTTARTDYTNGVDVHTGSGWIVRNNLFRNIISPSSILAGPAVLIWNSSRNAIVEGNTFINCQREISMGLIEKTPDDSSGGIIRNNFIYRRSGLRGDAAILVADSPNTQVLHNSILVNGTYPTPIEYRFAGTTGTVIKNNLLDGQIQARNGATGVVANNYLSAVPSMFMNPAAGDMHLVAGATPVFNAAPFLANAPRDWDEDARSQTSTVDYGADEYGASTPPPDTTPPTLTGITPMGGVTGVSLAAIVRATFSEPMDAATITTSTLLLRTAANSLVPATVSYDATFRVGELTPSSPLAGGTTYTATITGGSAGVKDVAGNALANNYVSFFTTTGAPPTLPTVTLSASPTTITSGAASTLTWSSTNATSVSINQGIGTVTTSGTRSVSPAATTIYTVTATSAAGSVSATATVTVTAAAPLSIALSATTIAAGGNVTATIANGPGNAGDWVGLYGTGAADATYVDWKYLNGTRTRPGAGVTGANVTFTLPSTPGTYNVRFFLNDSWVKVATSATITVTAPAPPSIALSATTVAPGGTVTATIANGPGTAADWIAFHDASAADGTYLDWKYLNGTQTRPGAGMTAAAVSFTMPATPGTYNVRFFLNDSWVKLATSATITVTAPAPPTIALSATTVAPGGTVTATIANGPGKVGDWVALHGASAADATYVAWKYLNGTQTRPGTGMTGAAVSFTMPATPGTYNVRFFLNDSWTKLTTSATITVP